MHRYKNPEENTILEKIHQVVGSMHNTKDIANVTFGAVPPWSNILEYIVYAVRWSYHRMLQATPMLLDINFQPNYKDMWPRK